VLLLLSIATIPSIQNVYRFKFMSSSKISQHDPRSRLHFIKYVTKGGETTRYWECGICGKEFKHQYTLVRHLPVHTDQRNFKCDLCDMAFRQLSTLIQHKASKHSGNRQYVCEVCHKSFSRVSILICHKRTHNKDKSFKCDICDKGFHQKGNLVIHMNIHSDKNPYPCPQCAKGFNQKSNLTVHLKSCSKNILGSNMNSSVGEDSSVVINTTLVPNQTK